ncbi:ABC transporter B family member 26, chloroplastic [Tanacetum coccineum]
MDIKSNISYGCSRDMKQEDIEWAAKQAYAHDFICSFPNGYETIVDDELLSGGQKQRIAIARAIVRDPVILILDEPTNALDAESEYYIQELMVGLKNDMKTKRSILFIAHRLSTARAADRIVVMDNGQVAEIHPVFLLQFTCPFEDLHLIDGVQWVLARLDSNEMKSSSADLGLLVYLTCVRVL